MGRRLPVRIPACVVRDPEPLSQRLVIVAVSSKVDECRVPIGVYYRDTEAQAYEDGVPAAAEPGWTRAREPRDIGGLLDAYR